MKWKTMKKQTAKDEASNPLTSKYRLTKLAEHDSYLVRMNVADHENTPRKVLARLAEDCHGDVRSFAAWNANTPTASLLRLLQEPEHIIHRHAEESLGDGDHRKGIVAHLVQQGLDETELEEHSVSALIDFIELDWEYEIDDDEEDDRD
jgi:hypothetical protein